MRNFACFNELSIQPLCTSEDAVEQRVRNFLLMMDEVRSHTDVRRVRHDGDMTTISLTSSMTLQDYINTHTKDPAVIALFGIIIHPQVDMADESSLLSYVDTTVDVDLGNGNLIKADGFNAAYCQGTFCVGFESCNTWLNDFYQLSVTSNGQQKSVTWACISSPLVYSTEQQHAHRQPAFEQWLQQINLVLVSSVKQPHEKSIDLRDDHGKKELEEHAKLLCQHKNVEAVLTSLPFKPKTRNYIDNITDDGLIDVVLWWEDAGYSMRVKTTGRNVVETSEIARLLKEKYGRQ